MTNSNFEILAMDVIDWCKSHGTLDDAAIYFDGKAITTWETWHGVGGREITPGLYEYQDKNPLDYFEYANPETLSMSFEGMLYDLVNDFGCEFGFLWESFNKVFEKHGCYYELGNSWNLSVAQL